MIDQVKTAADAAAQTKALEALRAYVEANPFARDQVMTVYLTTDDARLQKALMSIIAPAKSRPAAKPKAPIEIPAPLAPAEMYQNRLAELTKANATKDAEVKMERFLQDHPEFKPKIC